MIQYRGKISIFELLAYAPCIPIALWLTVRHGLRRSAGWIYVIIFAQVRAAGAITQLLSESHKTNTSLYTAEVILQSIGLNPLIFIAVCHLSRVNRSISIEHSRPRPISRWITHGIGSIIIVASALSIVGGINSSKDLTKSSSGTTRTFHPATTTKIGIVLFVISYAAVNLATWRTATYLRTIDPSERRLGYAIILSLVFIAIRLIYSLLAVFSTNRKFNLLTGSVTIWLVMAVLEEIIIVIIFLVAGLTMGKVEKRPHVHSGSDQIPMTQQDVPKGYEPVQAGY